MKSGYMENELSLVRILLFLHKLNLNKGCSQNMGSMGPSGGRPSENDKKTFQNYPIMRIWSDYSSISIPCK
jgi:hypothetical protein